MISCEITLIITLVSVILSEIHTVRSRIFRANKPPHDKAGIKDSGTWQYNKAVPLNASEKSGLPIILLSLNKCNKLTYCWVQTLRWLCLLWWSCPIAIVRPLKHTAQSILEVDDELKRHPVLRKFVQPRSERYKLATHIEYSYNLMSNQ